MATKVEARLTAENMRLQKLVDTNVYRYRDPWLSFYYDADSNRVNLQYDTSLHIVKYHKRKRLLGSKQSFIDIFSDDPRVTINQVKRFTVAEKRQKRLGLGIHAGYSYSPLLKRLMPTVGIGFQYNVVEF